MILFDMNMIQQIINSVEEKKSSCHIIMSFLSFLSFKKKILFSSAFAGGTWSYFSSMLCFLRGNVVWELSSLWPGMVSPMLCVYHACLSVCVDESLPFILFPNLQLYSSMELKTYFKLLCFCILENFFQSGSCRHPVFRRGMSVTLLTTTEISDFDSIFSVLYSTLDPISTLYKATSIAYKILERTCNTWLIWNRNLFLLASQTLFKNPAL